MRRRANLFLLVALQITVSWHASNCTKTVAVCPGTRPTRASDEGCMTVKNCALVAMMESTKRVKSSFTGAKDMVPWKGYRGKPDLLRKWHYAKRVYIAAIFDVVGAHILWHVYTWMFLSWQQAVRCFSFVCIHICLLGVLKRGKTNVFLYICIRYIYIQTTVHNVHSAVLCSVHKVAKRKKRESRLYIM